jgi:RNA polymerase sigma-70 factor (ECF subfamily)
VKVDFAGILKDNQSMVFSLALRFVRDRAGAEELAQDVFLQLYQQLDRIESPAHATWWLRRTVCHRSIDEVRKRKIRPRVGLESAPEPVDKAVSPDLFLEERIRRMVEELPEKARMVVTLRYQEDLDPMEISDLLGMPVSTVKSHLHRSLTVLRTRLAKSGRKEEVCS